MFLLGGQFTQELSRGQNIDLIDSTRGNAADGSGNLACGVHNPCQALLIRGNLGKNDTGTNYDPAKQLATSKVTSIFGQNGKFRSRAFSHYTSHVVVIHKSRNVDWIS